MNSRETKKLISELLEDLASSRSVEDITEVEDDIRQMLVGGAFGESYIQAIDAEIRRTISDLGSLPSRQFLLNRGSEAQRLQLLRRVAPECKHHPGEPMILQESMSDSGELKNRFWGCKYYSGSKADSCFFKRPLSRAEKDFLELKISFDDLQKIIEEKYSSIKEVPVIEKMCTDVAKIVKPSDSIKRNYAAEFLARLVDRLDPFTGAELKTDSIWLHPTVQHDVARVLAIHSAFQDLGSDSVEIPEDEIIEREIDANKLRKLSEIFEKTPLIQIVMKLKSQYPGSKVIIQNGCYYEIFGEDATFFADKFDWKVYERSQGILVTGFPIFATRVWSNLESDSIPFVVVSQLPVDDGEAANIVRRTVTRVFSPQNAT